MLIITAKTLFLLVAIALGEMMNGIFRTVFLGPRFGDFRARQVALIPGVIIIYSIGWFFVPWINPSNSAECYFVGFILMLGMALFDALFGRFMFKFPWERIAQDFNVFKGNLLTIGLIALFFMPVLIFSTFK